MPGLTPLCDKTRVIRTVTAVVTVSVIFVLLLLAPSGKPVLARSQTEINERYLSPIEMALSPDGRLLYVVCQGSDELRVVDAITHKVVGIAPVGRAPRGI